MRDIEKTIIMQYLHSPALLGLIRGFNAAIDPEAWLQAFYAKVFDVDTAEGWGLDVWGRIVAIERTLEIEGSDWLPFGFKGQTCANFGHGPFYNRSVSNNFILQDNAYRLLIMLKAASNITDGTLPSLNNIIARLFEGQGRAAVVHTGTMKIRFIFYFNLEPFQRAWLLCDDVPPKPAGVGYDVYEVRPEITFGFRGTGGRNFNHGIFQPKGPQDGYTVNS